MLPNEKSVSHYVVIRGFLEEENRLTFQQHGVTLVFQGCLLDTEASASAIFFIISSASSWVCTSILISNPSV